MPLDEEIQNRARYNGQNFPRNGCQDKPSFIYALSVPRRIASRPCAIGRLEEAPAGRHRGDRVAGPIDSIDSHGIRRRLIDAEHVEAGGESDDEKWDAPRENVKNDE